MTVIGTLAIALLLLGASLVAAIYIQARTVQARPVDAIIILGTAQYDGRPSPALRARLEETLELWRAGLARYVVVTGGKMEGDRFTEAEASRAYLVDHGVPASVILMEVSGRSSWQSMQGAAEALAQVGAKRVLIVSDGFHLFRLKLMARKLGLDAIASPADESPIRPNSVTELSYVLREAAATLLFLIEH